jgi:hypothetical protein
MTNNPLLVFDNTGTYLVLISSVRGVDLDARYTDGVLPDFLADLGRKAQQGRVDGIGLDAALPLAMTLYV